MYASFHVLGNWDILYMLLKRLRRKVEHCGPAHFSISLELWSRLVALPLASFLVWERSSVVVMSSSSGRSCMWSVVGCQ